MEQRPTGSTCPPTCPCTCTGQPPPMTAPPTRSSETCLGPADHQTRPIYTPSPTAPSTCTSVQNRSSTNKPTGSPPNPTNNSRSSSVSTDPLNPCSTRRGHCPM